MKKPIFTRLLSLLLCFVMLFGLFGTVAYAQEPQEAAPQGSAAFSEGTYTTILTKPVMSGRVTYGIEVVFAKGNYTYTTSIFLSGMSDDSMNGDQGTDTYSGTYTVNGTSLTMSGGNLSSGTVQSDGSLELNGVLSRYAFNKSSTFTVKRTGSAPEVPDTYEDNLKAGKYALTAEDYPESAMMKLPAYITIDTTAKTLKVQAASDLADKGFGTYTFDETTGVYTVTYTADTTVGAQTTFTFANDAITFTSPLYYGKARINVLDDNGNFIPYTAKLTKGTTPEVPDTYEDNLKAGKYALTAEDYPESAMMKLPAYITIDTTAKTLKVQAASDLADKGFGTYTFDETTGVYTVTYTADTTVGAQTTFTFANDAITFTSPLYYGKARINVLDDNGNFIPYTAKLVKDDGGEDPVTPFVYAILDGANGTVAQGAAVEYRLRANGPAAKLAAIGLDGEAISAEAYQISGESETVIVLTAEFMKSLSAGTHTIRLMYVDGSVETTLTVREVTNPVDPNPGDSSAPKTSDSAPIVMWLLAGSMSACTAAALFVSAKKKQKHN